MDLKSNLCVHDLRGRGRALRSSTIGPDGNLYGTTVNGGDSKCVNSFGYGCGVVYKLTPPPTRCLSVQCPWDYTVLYTFTGGADGGNPYLGSLVFDQAGSLYGTAALGGNMTGPCAAHQGCGVVFKLTRSGDSWTESVLYSFTGGSDGFFPASGVTFDNKGNLYGTTVWGGYIGPCSPSGCGVVYELSPSNGGWTENVPYSFYGNASGSEPFGGVAFDSQGNLFGTTFYGGKGGTIYELSPSKGGWTYGMVSNIPYGNGSLTGVAIDAADNLYGVLFSGSIYEVSKSGGGWTFTVLHNVSGSDGDEPEGLPVIDAAGNLYGTTVQGGTQCQPYGCGTAWQITP